MANGSSLGAVGEVHTVPASDRQDVCIEVHPGARAFWKRCLDLTVTVPLLLFGFPLFVLIACLVKLTSRGPIFYKSRRVGLGGRPFHMLKFRSMHVDADRRVTQLWEQNDHAGPIFKMKHDPRITAMGRLLRRTSLDELPQLLNVLVGEMSLVGPRPLHEYEIAEFDDYAKERLSVKPGITCYWQIMGRSKLTFEEWMKLDHRYLNEMSCATDLRILIRTPWAVLFGDGAY